MTEISTKQRSGDKDDNREFWRSMLEEVTAPTPFMIDSPDYIRDGVDEETREQSVQLLAGSKLLQAFCGEHAASIESVAASLWAILLSRYSGNEHVLFALDDGRPAANSVTWIPISVSVPSSLSFASLLGIVNAEIDTLADKTNPGLSELQALSGVNDQTPLLESLVRTGAGGFDSPQLPLCLDIENTDELIFTVKYRSPRFTDASVSRLLGHFQSLFTGCIGEPERSIAEVSMLQDDEQSQILDGWNNTATEFPDDKCLHEVFEEQVTKTPDAIAVINDSEQLTYRQLNEKANQLAAYLCDLGACAGKLVAISLGRSLAMPISMMAVAKSGAAYVPLDPGYPEDRLSFMLQDTEALILITESTIAATFSGFKGKLVVVDDEWPAIEKCSDKNVNAAVSPLDLAYVIYTSGSTGMPKGAVLNHQGRVNNFSDFNRRYDIGAGDTVLALASISFDMSVYDVFGTLMCGARLVIADASSIHGAANWARLMHKHKVSVWHSVPALMEMLVDHAEKNSEHHVDALRLVLLGGDWIPVALPDRLKALVPDIHVVSMGGATEVSMDSTIYDIEDRSSDWKSIPYGFPMANQLTYVLDAALQPLPVGVPGELHLGGVGVGEGYWKREELTAEKFIPNPFRANERIYKTGDLARFDENGCLELLGRIDFQVKIRGFRVELGEIESRLRKHADVRECVVLAKEDSNKNKRLVAYVLPEDSGKSIVESHAQQVEKWAAVYDHAYSAVDDTPSDDETFKITSWDSSYTDQPYPESVMRTWVDSTVDRIRGFGANRVLEIGCGTGLLLFRLAPDCEHYHGTDISDVALDHVATHTKRLGLDQVTLEKRGGDNFEGLEKGSFDAVVLNSIVMDFPDVDYLTRVLTGAAELLAPGGKIFVGDVRDLRSFEAFQTSVQLSKSRSALQPESLKQLIGQRMDNEEELLLDPLYFASLVDEIDAVSRVSIQLKRGLADNEMTKFRYDVTLSTNDGSSAETSDVEWLDWNEESHSPEKLQAAIRASSDDFIAIRNIPNERLVNDITAVKLLEDGSLYESVRELRRAVGASASERACVDPEMIWREAEQVGRVADVRCAVASGYETFDIVVAPAGVNGCQSVTSTWQIHADKSLHDYANNPLQAMERRGLVAKLRGYLANSLPDYMVPSAFLVMDKFPLSPNGKLNRRAFPEPDNLRPDLIEAFVPASTALEKVVSELWCECLNIDRAGLMDGFIELGGNSLLATQVVSRIKEIFDVDMPLTYGINSTLKELSDQIDVTASASGMDAHDTASVYLELLTMSEEELQSQLNS